MGDTGRGGEETEALLQTKVVDEDGTLSSHEVVKVESIPWYFLAERIGMPLLIGSCGTGCALLYSIARGGLLHSQEVTPEAFDTMATANCVSYHACFWVYMAYAYARGFYHQAVDHYPLLAGILELDRTEAVREPACGSRWFSIKIFKFLGLFLMMYFITMPATAVPTYLAPPFIWWETVAASFTWCASKCHESNKTSYAKACHSFGLSPKDTAKYVVPAEHWEKVLFGSMVYKGPNSNDSFWKDVIVGIEAEIHQRMEELHDLKRCEACFGTATNSSLYVQRMVKQGNLFAAYESQFRKYHALSVTEVYALGPLFFSFVLLFTIVQAVGYKKKNLRQHMHTFLRAHILDDSCRLVRYYLGFKYLDALMHGSWAAEERETSIWVLKALGQCKDKASRMDVEDGSLDYNDETTGNLGQTIKKLLSLICSRTSLKTAVSGIGLALVHTGIPVALRFVAYGNLSLSGLQVAVYPNKTIGSILFLNYFHSIIMWSILWAAILTAYRDYNAKKKILQAFDCMWRFPDENPVEMMSTGGGGRMAAQAKAIGEAMRQEVKDQATTTYKKLKLNKPLWSSCGFYFADFRSRNVKDLHNSLGRLNMWFQMRRFMQIHIMDSRVALELWSIILILIMGPSVLLGIANFMTFTDDRSLVNQMGSVVALFDFMVGAIFLLLFLSLTLDFNNTFRHHMQQLQALRDHLNLTYAAAVLRGFESDEERSACEQWQAVLALIEGFEGAMKTFNKPATLFNVVVDETLITRLRTVIVGLVTANVYTIGLALAKPFFNLG